MNIETTDLSRAKPRDQKSLIKSISQDCAKGNLTRLRDTIETLSQERDWSISPATAIFGRFKRYGLETELASILWDSRIVTLKDVRTAAIFIQLVGADKWDSEYFEPAYSLIRNEGVISNTFCEGDYLSSFSKLSPNAYVYLQHLKYGKFLTAPASGNIFDDARVYAGAVILDEGISKFLYEHSRVKLGAEEEWLNERKIVYFLEHFYADTHLIQLSNKARLDTGGLGKCINELIHSAETKALFDRMRETGPYLVCTFHAGNYLVSQSAYNFHMADHWTIRNRGNAAGNHIIVSESRLNSAFKAIKVLMSGKSLLIAPDSNVEDSRHVSTLNILGKDIAVPDGAARIAYEANAKVGWYTASIEGARYVPVFVEGPQKAAGESFDSFKARFASFYSEQVTATLSSHPRNTILKSFFRKFLSRTPAVNTHPDDVDHLVA